MGFGFGKKKKNISSDTTPAAADIKTTLDEDGNVEIVSKNFKMKPTQKLAEQPSSEGNIWICWGCGQPTDQDICPVCGKRSAQSNNTHTQGAVKNRIQFFRSPFLLYCNAVTAHRLHLFSLHSAKM